MNPETKKRYIQAMEAQLGHAKDYQRELAYQQSLEYSNPGDLIDRMNARWRIPCQLSKMPPAIENTLQVLKSLPNQPLTKIEHGATLTMAEIGAGSADLSPENSYFFLDSSTCKKLGLKPVNGCSIALAKIPEGSNFLLSDSPVGKNIASKVAGSEVSYSDLDGNLRKVKILSVE